MKQNEKRFQEELSKRLRSNIFGEVHCPVYHCIFFCWIFFSSIILFFVALFFSSLFFIIYFFYFFVFSPFFFFFLIIFTLVFSSTVLLHYFFYCLPERSQSTWSSSGPAINHFFRERLRTLAWIRAIKIHWWNQVNRI